MHKSGWDAQSSGNTSQQFKTVVAETSSELKNIAEEQINVCGNFMQILLHKHLMTRGKRDS